MSAYPIISAGHLDPAAGRGPFGLGRKMRGKELPRAGAHQHLVYLVDGEYIVDTGRARPDDDQVVRARHVTVVDTSVEVPVTVQLVLPSADASEFTVRVTFACTVTDAARVVRENVRVEQALVAYLHRHQKLGQIGMHRRIADVNQVRREVAGRVRAYSQVRPPSLPGLRVVYNGTDVLTPEEVRGLAQKRREAHAAHVLETERQGYGHELEENQASHTRKIAHGDRQATRDAAEEARQDKVRDRDVERFMKAEDMEFARRQVKEAVDAIGGDPFKTLVYAQSLGEIDARELADRISEQQRLELQATREYEERLRQEEHETYVDERNWKREGDRELDQWHRRQIEQQKEWDRQDRNEQRNINVRLVEELIRRGHADLLNVRLERLLEEVSGLPENTLGDRARDEALTAGPAGEAAPIEAPKAAAGDADVVDVEPVDVDLHDDDDDD